MSSILYIPKKGFRVWSAGCGDIQAARYLKREVAAFCAKCKVCKMTPVKAYFDPQFPDKKGAK